MSTEAVATSPAKWFKRLVAAIIVGNLLLIVWAMTPHDPLRKALGVPMPGSARDIRCVDQSREAGSLFLSAAVPFEDFRAIANRLDMTERSDLPAQWPTAFEGPPGKVWLNHPEVATNIFFVDQTNRSVRILAHYEEGRMYLKRSRY